jgi:hypothetical protein
LDGKAATVGLLERPSAAAEAFSARKKRMYGYSPISLNGLTAGTLGTVETIRTDSPAAL